MLSNTNKKFVYIDLTNPPNAFFDLWTMFVILHIIIVLKQVNCKMGYVRWARNAYIEDFMLPTIKYELSYNKSVAIIVHLNTNHFAALYIPYKQNVARYCDPLGYAIPPQMKQDIETYLQITVESEKIHLQHDGFNCGPYTLYCFEQFIDEVDLYNIDGNQLRWYYKSLLDLNEITDNSSFTLYFYNNVQPFLITEPTHLRILRETNEKKGVYEFWQVKYKKTNGIINSIPNALTISNTQPIVTLSPVKKNDEWNYINLRSCNNLARYYNANVMVILLKTLLPLASIHLLDVSRTQQIDLRSLISTSQKGDIGILLQNKQIFSAMYFKPNVGHGYDIYYKNPHGYKISPELKEKTSNLGINKFTDLSENNEMVSNTDASGQYVVEYLVQFSEEQYQNNPFTLESVSKLRNAHEDKMNEIGIFDTYTLRVYAKIEQKQADLNIQFNNLKISSGVNYIPEMIFCLLLYRLGRINNTQNLKFFVLPLFFLDTQLTLLDIYLKNNFNIAIVVTLEQNTYGALYLPYMDFNVAYYNSPMGNDTPENVLNLCKVLNRTQITNNKEILKGVNQLNDGVVIIYILEKFCKHEFHKLKTYTSVNNVYVGRRITGDKNFLESPNYLNIKTVDAFINNYNEHVVPYLVDIDMFNDLEYCHKDKPLEVPSPITDAPSISTSQSEPIDVDDDFINEPVSVNDSTDTQMYDDIHSKISLVYPIDFNKITVPQNQCDEIKKKRILAKYYRDDDGKAYVRCPSNVILKVIPYLYHKVLRGAYSSKFPKYCKYDNNDFHEWKRINNILLYVLIPSHKNKRKNCQRHTSGKRTMLYIPISTWQYQGLSKHIFEYIFISDKCTKEGLKKKPKHELVIDGHSIGFT